MPRRWGGSVTRFWAIILELRVKAVVFARIVRRFDRRVRGRGLGG